MYVGLQSKYQLFLSYINETWILPTNFRKILKHEIHPVRAGLFHVDGQTEKRDDANSHFSQILRTRAKNEQQNQVN